MIERLLGMGPVSPTLSGLLWTLMVTGTVCVLTLAGYLAAVVVKATVRSAYRLACTLYIVAGGTALGLARVVDRIRGVVRRVQQGVLTTAFRVRNAIHGAVARVTGAARSVVLAVAFALRSTVLRVLAGVWSLLRPRRSAGIGVTPQALFQAWIQLRWGRTVLLACPPRAFSVEALQKMAQAGGRFMVRDSVVIGALPVRRGVAEQDVVRLVRAGMPRGAVVAFETVHWFSQQTVSAALRDVVQRQAEMVAAKAAKAERKAAAETVALNLEAIAPPAVRRMVRRRPRAKRSLQTA